MSRIRPCPPAALVVLLCLAAPPTNAANSGKAAGNTATSPRQQSIAYRLPTPDGKMVVLFSSGKWAIDTSGVAPTALHVKAAIIMRNGDTKPLARLTVYVLTGDIADTLKSTQKNILGSEDKLDEAKGRGLSGLDIYYRHVNPFIHYIDGVSLSTAFLDERSKEEVWFGHNHDLEAACASAGRAYIERHLVKEVVTDFDGNVTITGLAPGELYLHAYRVVGSSYAFWSYPVTVSGGSQDVILENANMRDAP